MAPDTLTKVPVSSKAVIAAREMLDSGAVVVPKDSDDRPTDRGWTAFEVLHEGTLMQAGKWASKIFSVHPTARLLTNESKDTRVAHYLRLAARRSLNRCQFDQATTTLRQQPYWTPTFQGSTSQLWKRICGARCQVWRSMIQGRRGIDPRSRLRSQPECSQAPLLDY